MSTPPPAKTFLLSVQDANVRGQLEQTIMMLVSDVEVFTKMPGTAAPRVLITDSADISSLISDANLGSTGIISLKKPQNEDKYLDDVVSNKLQIVHSLTDETRLLETFNKALQFSFEFGKAEFRQRTIAAGESLFKMGDRADHVYLLKKGKLRVFTTGDSGEKELGFVSPGDFVGEMAYFNSDPRIASVSASETSELIEIPIHNFEAVLMQKPLWCKKLLQSMSARMKEMARSRK